MYILYKSHQGCYSGSIITSIFMKWLWRKITIFIVQKKNTEALIIYEPLARIICTCLKAIFNIVSMQFDPSLRPFWANNFALFGNLWWIEFNNYFALYTMSEKSAEALFTEKLTQFLNYGPASLFLCFQLNTTSWSVGSKR